MHILQLGDDLLLVSVQLLKPLLDSGMADSVGHATVWVQGDAVDACGVGASPRSKFSRFETIQSLKLHPHVQHVLDTISVLDFPGSSRDLTIFEFFWSGMGNEKSGMGNEIQVSDRLAHRLSDTGWEVGSGKCHSRSALNLLLEPCG